MVLMCVDSVRLVYRRDIGKMSEQFSRIELLIGNEGIEKLQKALDQAQMLNAMDKQKLLELEDKMAAVDQEQSQEVEEPVKKKWWQKLFNIV